MSIESWLREELRFSRSYYQTWGRRVVRAIDVDDCVTLSKIFQPKLYVNLNINHIHEMGDSDQINVNAQVKGTTGYGNYLWSPWMHIYHGDTALHLALRQKKLKCIYALLLLDSDVSIKNETGVSGIELCFKQYGRDIMELKFEAMKVLMNLLDPRLYDYLPLKLPYKGNNTCEDIKKESFILMEQGRNLYSNIPLSFQFLDLIPPKKEFNPYVRKVDKVLKRAYIFNNLTGKRRWLTEEEEKEVAKFWKKVTHKYTGELYYENEYTGATSKTKPSSYEDSDDEKEALSNIIESWNNYDEEEELEKLKLERQKAAAIQVEQEEKNRIKSEIEADKVRKRLEDIANRQALGIEKLPPTDLELEELRLRRIECKKSEDQYGISLTSAAKAGMDVYSRDKIIDIVRLIENQNRHWRKKEQKEQLKKSGLTLKAISEGHHDVTHSLMKDLDEMRGIEKLKFVKIKALNNIIKEYNIESDKKKDMTQYSKWIQIISTQTNLKYMNIGDNGLIFLLPALCSSKCIHTINLSNARLSCKSVVDLAKNLHMIQGLTELNLSGNAIMDDGAIALANSLKNDSHNNLDSEDHSRRAFVKQVDSNSNHIHSHVSILEASVISSQKVILTKLILLGNRISDIAIEKLVHVVLSEECPVKYLSLKQNQINQGTKNKLILLIEHFNDRARKIYEHAMSSILVTTRDKIVNTKTSDDSITPIDKSKLIKKQSSFIARKQSFVVGKRDVTSDSQNIQTEPSVVINHTKQIFL